MTCPPTRSAAHRHVPRDQAGLPESPAAVRVVHAGAGADAARHPGHLHRATDARRRRRATLRGVLARPTPTSRSCTCCPRAVGRTPRRRSAPTALHLQVAVDADAGRLVVVGAIDNLGKGAAGQARAERQPDARASRRPPACPIERRSAPMSVTAAAGFRAAGVAAGLKASGGPTSRWWSTTARSTPPPAVFTAQPGQGRAGAVVRSRCSPSGRLRAVVLNSGGANACTGPDGFADTHATAEQVAAVLGVGAGEVAVCSTGLIGERLPMDDAARRASTPPRRRSPPTAVPDAADAIRTTDTVAKQAARHRRRLDGRRHGQGRRHARARRWPRCSACSPPTPWSTQRPLDAALRAATPHDLRPASTPTAACRRTTPCCCWPAAPRASRPRPDDVRRRGARGVRRPGRGSCIADAEGATKEIAIEVVGAAQRGRRGRGRPAAIARDNLLKMRAASATTPTGAGSLAAVGTTQAAFDPHALDVAINGVLGLPRRRGRCGPRRASTCPAATITSTIDLHAGASRRRRSGPTTSPHAYVEENSAYST